jgi:hypothetical protein
MRSNGYMFQGLGTQDLKRLSQAKTARYLASQLGVAIPRLSPSVWRNAP